MSTLTDLSPLKYLAVLEMSDKRKRYPSVPEKFLVKPKFLVKDANSLTKTVIRCLELHGCHPNRIQSQGQYNGYTGQWQRGTTRKGTADISAIIGGQHKGQHCSIEIKWGKDRISADQKKTAESVQAAGGVYIVIRTYDEFWAWFCDYAPDLVELLVAAIEDQPTPDGDEDEADLLPFGPVPPRDSDN